MDDTERTKAQLITELEELRRKIADDNIDKKAQDSNVRFKEQDLSKLWETHTASSSSMEAAGLFRRIFQDHGAVMYIVDLSNFAIIDANKAALRFYGYDLKTMLTKRVPDLNITPEAEIRFEIERATEEGRFNYFFKHKLASGEIRNIEVFANPILIRGKEYSFSIVHDVTEHKQAEKQLRFLSALTANMSDSVIATDTNFTITYLNSKAEEMFGYNIEELQGQTPGVFNAEPLANAIQSEMYATLSLGKVYLGESLNRRKDGSTFVCEYKVTPLMSIPAQTCHRFRPKPATCFG